MRARSRAARGLALGALVAAFATAARAARAEELLHYTVQAGDTCETVAQKLFADSSATELLHKYNPQLGPRPHHLKPGQVLAMPPPTPDARLTAMHNQVKVQMKPATPNEALFRGNRVVTGDDSTAEMTFRDQTELSMGAKTLVIVLGSTRSAAKTSDAALITGALRARLGELTGKPPAPLQVTTPAARVALGPGEAKVHVDAAQATRLAVYHGRSSITAVAKTVDVPEGFGSVAERGQAPTPPRALPAAPAWKKPFPALTLATGDAVDVSAEYAKGSGGPDAAKWHVQLARDERFLDPVVDAVVPASVVELAAKKLGDGTYFARASAIDAQDFEGPFTAVSKIAVARAKTTELPNHFGSMQVPEGVRCAVDDGQPATGELRFDRLGKHVARCGAEGAPPTTIELPADDASALHVDAKWLDSDARARMGHVAIAFLDAHGDPIARDDAQLAALAAGVGVSDVHPATGGAGYLATVRWPEGTKEIAYRLSVSGVDVESPPLAVPDVPTRRRPKEEVSFDGALAGGVGYLGASGGQIGPRVDWRARVRLPTAIGEITLGAAATFERYAAESADAGAGAPPPGSASHSDLGVGPQVGWVLGHTWNRWRPYAAITPQVFVQSTTAATSARYHATLVGVTGSVGFELNLGGGALFLEGGFRGTTVTTDSGQSEPLTGPVGLAGASLRL
jgi:hypothetical protein